MSTPLKTAAVSVPVTAVLDVIAVVVFVAIGRSNHDEAFSPLGFAHTLWPFLAGAAAGWLIAYFLGDRAAFAPGRLVPSGVVVWLSTVIVGMLLRVVSGQGTALSFCIVATIATGVLLLGWRAVAALVLRRR